jgi:hypothetical protein
VAGSPDKLSAFHYLLTKRDEGGKATRKVTTEVRFVGFDCRGNQPSLPRLSRNGRSQQKRGHLHSYRSWLDAVGTAITVQQKLMRHSDIRTTLNVLADLDYLINPKVNTIGALMLHLAATETYYQLNTFEGRKLG